MKGWYVPSRPDEPAGESTFWYASFWQFCVAYLDSRFGKEWSVSPEQSVSLHTGNWTVPRQLLVRAPKGGNKPIGLICDTSIFDVRLDMPPEADRAILNGVALTAFLPPWSVVRRFSSSPDPRSCERRSQC